MLIVMSVSLFINGILPRAVFLLQHIEDFSEERDSPSSIRGGEGLVKN